MQQHNNLGPIAESYEELQGLRWLRETWSKDHYPSASLASTLRVVLQGVEIGLLNQAQLLDRASECLAHLDLPSTLDYLRWSYAFHSVLISLGQVPQRLGLPEDDTSDGVTVLSIKESPAFQRFTERFQRFEEIGLRYFSGVTDTPDSGSEQFSRLILLCNQLGVTWEENFSQLTLPIVVSGYAEYIGAVELREMVIEFTLEQPTVLMQFRALHQIPEALGAVMADHLVAAIHALREDTLITAIEHVKTSNALGQVVVRCAETLSESLTFSQYHQIRENLGMTSGSHSATLHYALFYDLYHQLWDQVTSFLRVGDTITEDQIRQIDRARGDGPTEWLRSYLLSGCLEMRAILRQWRDTHLHLPRCNLGGGGVRSLVGATDATATVRSLRDKATQSDPLSDLARARGLLGAVHGLPVRPFDAIVKNSASLDSLVLEWIGALTKQRFSTVQERKEYFSQACPFHRPPPRKA